MSLSKGHTGSGIPATDRTEAPDLCDTAIGTYFNRISSESSGSGVRAT